MPVSENTLPTTKTTNGPDDDRPLAVFDLDGTLVRRDTFLPFLITYGRRCRRVWPFVLLPWPIAAYLGRLMSDRAAKQRLLVSFLAGQPIERIEEHAEWFCDRWLPSRLNGPVIKELRRHQEAGHRVILLSASPSVYVPAVARSLEISEVICTRVEHSGETCLGRLSGPNCKGDMKLQLLQEHLGVAEPPAGSFAYGDSRHDVPVLQWVQQGRLVRGGKLTSVNEHRLAVLPASIRRQSDDSSRNQTRPSFGRIRGLTPRGSPGESTDGQPVLLVFSDDWGRHPSSCQHIVSRLLDRYRVIWVNTIGMRAPSLNFATIKRGFEKLFQWTRRRDPPDRLPDNLRVLNPRMWPWFTSPRDRRLNFRLLSRALKPVIEKQQQPVTAITTIPIVADLVGELPVDRWVYYCVDDFSVWPGLDQKTLKAMEEELIPKVDEIVAVSETLQDRIQDEGRDAALLTHGVDLDFWQQPVVDGLPESVADFEKPWMVFWGVVDRRMDADFIRRLSADLDSGTVLLVGPAQDPDESLFTLPRVQHVPPVPLQVLPRLAAETDVLIMPYIDADVTRAMQPLKLKEYLATGKPAVVRDLPATRPWGDCLDLANSPAEFSRLVQQRSATGLPASQREARNRLAEESWENKARRFEEFALKTSPLAEAQT